MTHHRKDGDKHIDETLSGKVSPAVSAEKADHESKQYETSIVRFQRQGAGADDVDEQQSEESPLFTFHLLTKTNTAQVTLLSRTQTAFDKPTEDLVFHLKKK
jgi:hypothetical protein